MPNKKIAIAYIPVIHKGYLSYIESMIQEGVTELYLISDDILESHEELDYIHRKDRLRAVPQEVIQKMITENYPITVHMLSIAQVMQLHEDRVHIYTPREDINEFIIQTYFGGHFVTYSNVFLRWNRENIGEEKVPHGEVVPLTEVQEEIMGKVITEATKSADWWRQVGAALVKDGELISLAHNEHMPEEELPNIYGDTRALFKKGMNIHYVTAAHAEIGVIAEAAKKGISTEGTELYVTDFPCPYCARLIAKAGVKKVYYQKGYAVLAGDDFLKEMGVEIVLVGGQNESAQT